MKAVSLQTPRTAVFSVVYPSMNEYLDEFLQSCVAQTDPAFELFIVNDGLSGLTEKLQSYSLSIDVITAQGTPADIRQQGFREVLQRSYDFIIFSDSDDRMAANRVKVCREKLKNSDVIVNDLILFGEKHQPSIPMLSPRLSEDDQISENELRTFNFFGLSNTAIKTSIMRKINLKIPSNLLAFDWAYFSCVLASGAKALFTKKTHTEYRQHGTNIASPYIKTEQQVLTGVKVKKDHYTFMALQDASYLDLRDQFTQLEKKLQIDAAFKADYCRHVISSAGVAKFWWESISTG